MVREKIPRINIVGNFLSRRSLKKFSSKLLLDNNVTHLLEIFFARNVCRRRIMTLSKASNSLFDEKS